jgi:hypothetical protein
MSSSRWMLYESDPLMFPCLFILACLIYLLLVLYWFPISSSHIKQNPKIFPLTSTTNSKSCFVNFSLHPKNALNIDCTLLCFLYTFLNSFYLSSLLLYHHSCLPAHTFQLKAISGSMLINKLPLQTSWGRHMWQFFLRIKTSFFCLVTSPCRILPLYFIVSFNTIPNAIRCIRERNRRKSFTPFGQQCTILHSPLWQISSYLKKECDV